VKGKRCIEETEAAMERRIWIGLLLVVLASLSALLFFSSYTMHPSEAGFRIYSLQNTAVLVSDADILSRYSVI
jgi:hypothetical protein